MSSKQVKIYAGPDTHAKWQQICTGFSSNSAAFAALVENYYKENKMLPIKYNLNFAVGIDPYRSDTQGRTEPIAYIRPTDTAIHVIVEQTYPGQTGTDPDSFQDVSIYFGETNEYNETWTPDPTAFETYIKSPPARTLIERIATGYSTDWSGRNPGDGWLKAELDDDAQAALDELDATIADLPADKREFWTMQEWCGNVNIAQMSASEIDEAINDPTADQKIIIIDNPVEYLMEHAFHAIQDKLYMESADNDTLTHNEFTVTVKRDEDSIIIEILSIITPAAVTPMDPQHKKGARQ